MIDRGLNFMISKTNCLLMCNNDILFLHLFITAFICLTIWGCTIKKTEIDKNDYGLNDISARDSSEDESGPKKAVPSWAKRENRKPVLELQYHVDSKERALFFDCPKSISLKEMFKGMNIRDRPRTSSAVWNTPPRFSDYIRKN